MNAKREKWIGAGLCLTVFLSMLLFFEIAHPLVILDADDWTYISQSRIALPVTRFWNPARILPEILMPYASELGVLLFGRLGYLRSITVMNGLVLSLFICFYIRAFYRLLTDVLELAPGRSALLALLFLLLHFSLLRTAPDQNRYLFWSKDVTCVYYYVIPGLLNCGLVMNLARTGLHRRFWEKKELAQKSLLVLACYLAVFSNLFESAILAIWCGVELLQALLRGGKKLRSAAFWREQSFSLAVLLLWLLSVGFEGSGGRGAAGGSLSFGKALGESFRIAISFLGGIYALVLLFIGAALAALLLALLLRLLKGQERALCGELLLPLAGLGVLTLLFEILLCAKVAPAYAGRSDVMFGVCFVLLAHTVLALALLLKRWERLLVLLPLLLLVLYSVTDTQSRTFADSNDILAPAKVCMALDQNILDQVLAAEAAGEEQVTVHVFVSGGEDNWPHSIYLGDRVAASLYKHGLTSHLMEIRVLPDLQVNETFHVLEELVP